MRRSALLLFVLFVLVALCGSSFALEVNEVGIQVRLMHDPFLDDGNLRFAATVSGYCKIAVTEGWTMRAELGCPIDLWLPWVGLASSHEVGDRWAVEVQLAAQGDLVYSLHLTLNAGVRALLASSDRFRLMLASFPVSVTGLWYLSPSEFMLIPSISANATLDFAWAMSEHLVLGQSFGLSVARLGGLSTEMAFPLGEAVGLLIDSKTRIGYRP